MWKLRPKGLGVGYYQGTLLLVGESEERNNERDATGRRWDWVLQGKGYEQSLWNWGGLKGLLKNKKVL